jgi:hypothetical protein
VGWANINLGTFFFNLSIPQPDAKMRIILFSIFQTLFIVLRLVVGWANINLGTFFLNLSIPQPDAKMSFLSLSLK